jgi:hypothetical protein
MLKLSNFTGWSLAVYLYACGGTMSLTTLIPLSLLTAALLWFGFEVTDALKLQPNSVPGAPIASQVAYDLNIQVRA